MKIALRRLVIVGIAVGLAIVIGFLYWFHPNDLGLTRIDLRMGGNPSEDALRLSAQTAAEAGLARHRLEFAESIDTNVSLTVDYSKSSMV